MVLFFGSNAVAEKPSVDYTDFLKKVDCTGHKGATTVCFKNATSSDIVSARCGDYDVPLKTKNGTIPAGTVAAVIDLSNSIRTCRKQGITAYTDEGIAIQGTLNAATVDDSTEVWFRK